ncbi:type VI secretion protein [Pilimelia columellifera]|uniref:ATP-binding protein n=1 Tax=Pilimelia columellifera subsp. columellifera TaxID=706583 RepID=A0ABN3NHN1_9ACTN
MFRRKDNALPVADVADIITPPSHAPKLDKPAKEPKPPRRQAHRIPPRRGHPRPFHGRAPLVPNVPVHRGSTGQVQGIYPWLNGASLPPYGAYIGVDTITGAAFPCHPIEWLRRGLITNPNMLITGTPGAGKSGTIKAMGLRLMAYGVKMLVSGDIKGEYNKFAEALGVAPVKIGPGLPARLNPLDAGPLGRNLPHEEHALRERLDEVHRRRITLLSSLLSVRLHRELTPTEEAALSLAIHFAAGHSDRDRRVFDPTIPEVWALLRDPTPEMAYELRIRDDDPRELREMIRPTADALGNMVQGSLSGLFDGPSTVGLDFDAPIQTVDLSRLDGRNDDTISMTLACVSSWSQAAIDQADGPVRMVVRDELWRALRIPAMLRKVDSDLRLSRAQGTIQMLATHRLADFDSVGPEGSAEVAIARNLLASCDVRICMMQDITPLEATREAVGLTDTECAHIASWSGSENIGYGIWKIGRNNSYSVSVRMHPAERALFETNERMQVARG